MNIKTTTLCIALVPALALLVSCKKDHDSDEMTPPPAATAPADSTTSAPSTAQTMPANNMSSGTMAGSTAGGDGMTGAELSFADMDKNHDGSVSKDELASTDMLYQHFAVADADSNGMLSEAEVTKHRADMAAAPAK